MSSDYFDNTNRLRNVVDACIFIFQSLPVLGITDIEVKKSLGYVARRCNEIYDAQFDDVFKSSDDGK